MRANICIQGVNVIHAHHFWQRLIGLMGRRTLPTDQGLWLSPCSSVHTGFMRFAIDVVFLDKAGTIVSIVPGLRPWRAAIARRAHSCLELSSGNAERLGLEPGQQLIK